MKDAFIAGIQKNRPMLSQTIVAQAQRIDVDGARIVFHFGPIQTMLADQVAQQRQWLESLAADVAGRRMSVAAVVDKSAPVTDPRANGPAASPAPSGRIAAPAADEPRDLRAEALGDPAVQSLLDIIPSELRNVTELKDS